MSITALQNFYESTLSAGISSSDLVIPITNAPTPTEGWLLLDYDIPAKREFVYYTSANSTSVTVPSTGGRGQDNTAAIAHSQNAKVRMNVNGGLLMNVINAAATSVNQNNNGGWVPLTTVPTVTASNGQKEYVLTYSAANYTDRLQKGSKLMIPRSVVPPTQSMSFTSASSQYASKASPTGITFTSAFTCEAWVYINSYANMMIITRTDASAANGWFFKMNSTGQIELDYASGGNVTNILAYQSLPLKQWVHVAAVITSVSGKTGAIYMNGVAIPSALSASATTVLTQSGNLMVGTYGSPSGQYFDGYISEARVWSTAQTATQINNNMGISLTGSETNLVALFQGNGNFNDKTTNANNLTAVGGASSSSLVNPFSPIEYAIATNVAYIAGNTTVTVFSGQNVIPNATLSATSYSGQRAPFGFPVSRGKWIVQQIQRTTQQQSPAAINTWYNVGLSQLSIPAGEWVASYSTPVGISGTTNNILASATLSATNSTETNPELTVTTDSSSSSQVFTSLSKSGYITNATQAYWWLNVRSTTQNNYTLYNVNNEAAQVITAECAYL